MVVPNSGSAGIRIGQGILASSQSNPDKRNPQRARLPKELAYLSWVCIAMGVLLVVWFLVDQIPGEPISRSLILAPAVFFPLAVGIFGLVTYINWSIVLGNDSLEWRTRLGRTHTLKFSEITRAKVDSRYRPQTLRVWGPNGQRVRISVPYFQPTNLLRYLNEKSLITLNDG